MMNHRHLNEREKKVLRKLCDEAGAVETIRVIASIVAFDHPDLSEGREISSRLLAIAKELGESKTGLIGESREH